jgi:glycosyltransferase involved in cell wall biosynthesis
MEHLLSQLPPEARAKSHLVYHGVDIRTFEQLPLPATQKPLRVVSAGRLTPTKGFDRLIRGCALARQQGMDVELSILGRGAEEARLREVAAACDFGQYLELPGWVSHGAVRDYLARCHVFALMADTTFHDGLPNVVLEAMASGRPVILSPLPAAGEAVEDGCEGFILAAPDDFEGFAAALRSLFATSGLAARMAGAARHRVARDHDANVQITRLQKLINRRQHTPNT